MISIGKAAFGISAVVSISSSVAISQVRTNNWYKNHPETQKWLTDNKYTPKESNALSHFVKTPSENSFALGCHKLLFGDKVVKQLYKDSNIDDHKDKSATSYADRYLKGADIFGDRYEPVLGCSTAHTKQHNVYEFELALRQGDKGLVERISVHTNKIISQLVFYNKDKHLFGLYKYIWQNYQDSNKKNIYQWANPQTGTETNIWSDLAVIGSGDSNSKYYSVWVEGSSGGNMFDSLGIKSNGKLFSSLVDETHDKSSNFIYVPPSDNGELKQTLISDSTKPKRYDLSSLYYLRKQVHSRKGKWKQVTTFCPSVKSNMQERMNIKDLKQLTKYCYKTQEETKERKN